jgi:Sec-independent protein translocase protein TatA
VEWNNYTSAGRSPLLSPADLVVWGTAALLLFGPEQFPKVARKAGSVVRELQHTSRNFLREMERAADDSDLASSPRPHSKWLEEEPLEDIIEDLVMPVTHEPHTPHAPHGEPERAP